MTLQEELRGALARGYTTDDNSDKQLDAVLIEAMAKEVEKLIAPQGMVGRNFFNPLTLIDYGGGCFGPLMFHFASESEDAARLAQENGYDHYWVTMGDVLDDEHPAAVAYDKGLENALAMWEPPEARNGFTLIAKVDTDDGPVAHYVRKRTTEEVHGDQDTEHA